MQNQLTVRMKTVIDEEPIEGHKKKQPKRKSVWRLLKVSHTREVSLTV